MGLQLAIEERSDFLGMSLILDDFAEQEKSPSPFRTKLKLIRSRGKIAGAIFLMRLAGTLSIPAAPPTFCSDIAAVSSAAEIGVVRGVKVFSNTSGGEIDSPILIQNCSMLSVVGGGVRINVFVEVVNMG